ncbi:MAG TPA: ribonuclease HI [Steroidobacteraceae bacterium]|nr:ribonuclease HI [Steroidobacteraceae bacterium]
MVEIYADGACRGNPGPGGWGALLRSQGRERELSGAEAHTTNNRMELTAVIRALAALTRATQATVYTDSQYVVRGITEWVPAWKARDWRTADRQPVKNRELWEELERLAAPHELSWQWVRGHSGVAGNERVDRLANAAIDAMLGGPTREQQAQQQQGRHCARQEARQSVRPCPLQQARPVRA